MVFQVSSITKAMERIRLIMIVLPAELRQGSVLPAGKWSRSKILAGVELTVHVGRPRLTPAELRELLEGVIMLPRLWKNRFFVFCCLRGLKKRNFCTMGA